MKKCDVVMKGGITSGIVYPGAVCELAKEYEFSSIGGTSAGAIAAALTAAAEYRRQHGSNAGFEELAGLPKWLGETASGRSRLLQLFQPSEATAPLFDVVIAYLQSPRSVLGALVRGFNRYGGMVLAVAALLVTLEVMSFKNAGMAVVIAATLIVAAIGFVAASILEAIVAIIRTLPPNGFALCSGDTLAAWLDEKIGEVAGVARPLTFGDLTASGITLEMMTTNLTHRRPYRLPFETKAFLFSERELRRLFPARVVQWMIDKAARHVPADGDTLHSFPGRADLPVVVATRMSLSFPLLLSAVPLWSIDFGRRDETPAPERCWFSDGGITSNFPVHFFDAPLPRWPTFAFNLADRTPRYHAEQQRTYLPTSNLSGIHEWWTPFTSVVGFLGAIVGTMQNWRDNMLLHLPGQRDRVAHVLLAPDEGGLRLTMETKTIEDVAARGIEAAATLRAHFGDTPPPKVTLTWGNHKWARFLAFMPALENALESWATAFADRATPPSFDDLLSGAAPLPSYKVSVPERKAMHASSLAFLQHIQQNFGTRPFGSPRKRPSPEPVLRAMARE
jgi:predicted acylesterase/phospholipase RssA